MRTTTGADERLLPYRVGVDGEFGFDEAAHLHARTGFGATYADIEAASRMGLERALDSLFTDPDPGAARAWRRALDMGERIARRQDLGRLQAHWYLRMLRCPTPIREHLALFWHDHFATAHSKVGDTVTLHEQNRIFLERGAGSFEELLTAVASDAAMMLWLDNAKSSKYRPNENFARELLELFSLGVGHYSERDVREVARAFTGWGVRGGRFHFSPEDHDASPKTVFGETGAFGGKEVLSLCVARRECPTFVAGKLFRAFVGIEPDDALLTSLGEALREDGLHVETFLRRLLASRVFFAAASRRCIVRSPVHWLVGNLRALDASASTSRLAELGSAMGQSLYDPPSVDGWPTGRAWISTATLIARQNVAIAIAAGREAALRCRSGAGAEGAPHQVASALLARRVGPDEIAGLSSATSPEDVAGIVLLRPEAQLT